MLSFAKIPYVVKVIGQHLDSYFKVMYPRICLLFLFVFSWFVFNFRFIDLLSYLKSCELSSRSLHTQPKPLSAAPIMLSQ